MVPGAVRLDHVDWWSYWLAMLKLELPVVVRYLLEHFSFRFCDLVIFLLNQVQQYNRLVKKKKNYCYVQASRDQDNLETVMDTMSDY